MKTLIAQLSALQLLPVVVLEKAADVLPLGRIFTECGLPAIEITLRTPAALDAIHLLRNAHPNMLIGAGTVLTPNQARAAQQAGATFIVSPGFNERTAQTCADLAIEYIPGVNNPSSIEAALNCGLNVVKFFPAQASGGVPMLKALLAPYQAIWVMPTGGIHPGNIHDYLALDRVFACGGSWLTDAAHIQAKNWTHIAQCTQEVVQQLGKQDKL